MIKADLLVSVVIPSFNHIDYVEKAICSVLEQTYKNVELIVIDDGSNDGSIGFLEGLSERLGFTFLSQKNAGVCKTLNKGIRELSSGEYICILASDDYFHPKKIEKQVAALQANPDSEFSYTQAIEFDSVSSKEIRVFPVKDFSGKVLNKLALRQPYAAGSIMFSRSLYNNVGGFDSNLKYEDWDFSIRCAAQTVFTGVQFPLFYYRSHATNTMKTLGRRAIFHGKAVILSKNYLLMSPRVWFFSIVFNFMHDHLHFMFKIIDIRKIVN